VVSGKKKKTNNNKKKKKKEKQKKSREIDELVFGADEGRGVDLVIFSVMIEFPYTCRRGPVGPGGGCGVYQTLGPSQSGKAKCAYRGFQGCRGMPIGR